MEEIEGKIKPFVKTPARDAHIRKGKGFSLPEIKAAGKTVVLLKEMNIKIDFFRKSANNQNIEILKKLKPPKKTAKKKKPYRPKEKIIKKKPFKVKKKMMPTEKVEVDVEKTKTKVKPAVKAKRAAKTKPKEKAKAAPAKKPKAKAETGARPLTELSGLGPATAKKFIELGVDSVEALLKEKPKELAMLIKGCSEERIQNWIKEGKELKKK